MSWGDGDGGREEGRSERGREVGDGVRVSRWEVRKEEGDGGRGRVVEVDEGVVKVVGCERAGEGEGRVGGEGDECASQCLMR